MPSHIAQQRDIGELVQPVGIVDHDRIGRAIAEGEELLEHPADTGDVFVDFLIGQQLACLVLAGRVADLGRAATHEDDRLVPGFLQMTQHHDLDQ